MLLFTCCFLVIYPFSGIFLDQQLIDQCYFYIQESASLWKAQVLYICPFYLELFSILYHEVSWVKAGNTPWTGHPHSHTSVMLTLTPRSNVESPLWGWVFIKGHNEIRKTHLLHLIRLHLPYVANVEKKQIIRRMKNDFIYYWGH